MRTRTLLPLALLLAAGPASAEDGSSPVAPAAGDVLLVESPCPGPRCTAELVEPQAQGHRVVYLNFEGVTLTRSSSNDDARTNVSAIVNSSTEVIAAFKTSDLSSTGGLSRAQIIQKVVDDMYTLHANFNVDFVTSRPTSGYYSMIVFGGSCQSVVGSSGCAGIALLDCGDQMPANITFVFPPGQRVADLATTAAQEAAHAYGLGHTSDRSDVMYPQIQSSIPNHFGAGNIPDGSGCPSSATYQDSYQKMLDTIGPRGQDTTPPTVKITSPSAGATVGGGTLVTANANDNIAIDHVTLDIDGAVWGTLTDPPWQWALSSQIAIGDRVLTVRAYDINGNDGFDRITVKVDPNGGPQCTGPSDCGSNEECINGQCRPLTGGGGLGDQCTTSEECSSGLCAQNGDQQRCTSDCSSNACPSGFDCLGGAICWPADTGGGDVTGGDNIFSCSAGSGASGAAGLLLLAAVLSSRRRRTARR